MNLGNCSIYDSHKIFEKIAFSINAEINKDIILYFLSDSEFIFEQEFKCNLPKLHLDLSNLNKMISVISYNDEQKSHIKLGKTTIKKNMDPDNLGYIIKDKDIVLLNIFDKNGLIVFEIKGNLQIHIFYNYLINCRDVFIQKMCQSKTEQSKGVFNAPSF